MPLPLVPIALGAFLSASIVPLVKKVLIALGVGIISYAALNGVYAQVQSAVTSSWGQLGTVTLQLLSLAGFPDALGITLGALSARVALVAVERFGRVTA